MEVSFLTWNLAMLASSAQAPPGWGIEHTEAAVREEVLAIEPDLVLLQELPRMVPYVETHDMLRANPETHQGNLATLVSNELVAALGPPQVSAIEGCAVLATLGSGGDGLTVANVHLAPGPGAAPERLEQLAKVVEASPTEALAIVGDTNTRVAELDALADAGLTSPRPPRATWNSRRNRFAAGRAEFTAYFTRAIVSPTVAVSDQRVLDRPVEHGDHRFHLSDHFALAGRLVTTG